MPGTGRSLHWAGPAALIAAVLTASTAGCSKDKGGQDAAPKGASTLKCEMPPPRPPAAAAGKDRASGPGTAAPSPAAPGADPVAAYPDRRYRVEREGSPTGYIQVAWSRVNRDGRQLVRDETFREDWHHRKIAHMNDIFMTRSRTITLRTDDGELVETSTESDEGGDDGRHIVSRVEKTRSGYQYSALIQPKDGSPPTETKKSHETTARIMLDSEAFLVPKILDGSAKPGSTLEFRLLSGETGTVHRVEAVRQGSEEVEAAGRKHPCAVFLIRETATGSFHREFYTADALLLKHVAGDQTITFSSAEEIEALRKQLASGSVSLASPVRDTGLHTVPNLPGAFNLRALLVQATVRLRPNVPEPPFENSPFMEVVSREQAGKDQVRYLLRLKAHDAEGTAELPMQTKDLEKHLESTTLMQVDHPEVRRAAEEAVAGEKDARKAAERIAEYVFTRLDKRSGSLAEYSAVEILHNGFGDCSEHSRLFATLCRAAGIPAREVSGLVCLGNTWGPHSWGEIWLGKWVGADACTNDVGSAGRYIFYGYPDDPFGKTGLVSSAFSGYSSLRLLEGVFGDGEAVDLTGKESYCGSLPDGTGFSHLAGVACRKAKPDWTVRGRTEGVRVGGDRITAQVRVQPDQGARGEEQIRGYAYGGSTAVKVQGFPAVISRNMGPDVMVIISSLRRLIILQISFEGATLDQRRDEWDSLFRALDLTAWKGRPVKEQAEIPAYPVSGREEAPEEPPEEQGPGEEKGE